MYESDRLISSDDFDFLDIEGLAEEEDEYFDEDLEDLERFPDLAEVLRELMPETYEDALPEEIDEALADIFDSLTPAESLSLGSVLSGLGQVEKVIPKVFADPA